MGCRHITICRLKSVNSGTWQRMIMPVTEDKNTRDRPQRGTKRHVATFNNPAIQKNGTCSSATVCLDLQGGGHRAFHSSLSCKCRLSGDWSVAYSKKNPTLLSMLKCLLLPSVYHQTPLCRAVHLQRVSIEQHF